MGEMCECDVPVRNLYQSTCMRCGGCVLSEDGSGRMIFNPGYKLYFAASELPRLLDRNNGFCRRIECIDFTRNKRRSDKERSAENRKEDG